MLFYRDWSRGVFVGLFYSEVGVGKDLLYCGEMLGCFWSAGVGLRIAIRIEDCVVRDHIQRVGNSVINGRYGLQIDWLFRWGFCFNFLIELPKQLWLFNSYYINSVDLLNLTLTYPRAFLTIFLYIYWTYILLALLLLILKLLKGDLRIEVSAHFELKRAYFFIVFADHLEEAFEMLERSFEG